MAIKGAQDYYSIQWAERGPAQKTTVAFDEEKWWADSATDAVFLCDRVRASKRHTQAVVAPARRRCTKHLVKKFLGG